MRHRERESYELLVGEEIIQNEGSFFKTEEKERKQNGGKRKIEA